MPDAVRGELPGREDEVEDALGVQARRGALAADEPARRRETGASKANTAATGGSGSGPAVRLTAVAGA